MHEDNNKREALSGSPVIMNAEQVYAISRQQLQLFMSATHAGIWEWDTVTNSVIWSDEVWALYGLNASCCDATFEAWLSSVHPEDREKTEKTVLGAARDDVAFEVAWRSRDLDGNERWLMSKGFPLRDGAGRTGRYVGIVLDITDRKQAEDALCESEDRFRKLFESLSEIKLIIDSHSGKIIDANQAAVDFYGWSIEELTSMNIEQINTTSSELVTLDTEKCGSLHQSCVSFRHRRADGSIRDVEVFSNNIEIAGNILYYSTIHDVTERKRFEALTAFRLRLLDMAENRSVEELLKATLDESECMTESSFSFCCFLMDERSSPTLQVLSTSTEKAMSLMNRNQEVFSQLSESSIWSAAILEKKAVIHNDVERDLPEDHPFFKRKLVVPIVQGDTVMAIIGVGNKQYPYDEDDARWVGTLADVAWDIVARKRAELSEKNTQEALSQSQKMEMVGRLAGGIAHDFNNMLGVILGHTEIALEQLDPSESAYADLEAIRKAAARSAGLIRQLLAFARKQTVMPKIISLNTMVEGMLTMMRRLIGENITLVWIPENQNAKIKIDPSQIDQILANLCVNARDSIVGGGRITIETGRLCVQRNENTANHPCRIPGDYVTLAVTDNGSGIDKKHLPHIFEPFFTTKEQGKGTGLGLSTVYGIVKQNNGCIDCQSEPGKGTCIKIHLPRYIDKADSVPVETPEQSITRGKETILLVEDEPDILKLCKLMLENNGYTVLSADTPNEAIRIAAKHKGGIGLLLTDVVMPEMNGCDLSNKLRITSPNLKTLFMSGYTADIISRHGVLDDGGDFIQKPFSLKALMESVHNLLKPSSS
ncbi:PAS domain S-box protein [Chlorobium phaeobacteroides]|uniref:histidine kinase n=1 Tax=Chlorobium phaeobacteroides (strain DSM 266 / SMG 266 / 2430) TaxID=290317 RepID=A1BGP4_CHLPD|nr:PAS domain S-box protein [Chlorobium phaeobacteroides]ABL65571.1 PAS/PAC sensor hybrid histidine kinase [Chlorobium phaeobacteroides DSM 266]